MVNRLKLAIKSFFNPELPLFLLGLITAAIICILVAVIFWSTFQQGLPGFRVDLTLENYREVLFYPILPRAAKNTLITSVGTVIIACFFALPIAWLIHRTNIPYKKFFLTLMFLHVLLPGFLRTMGWIMMLSPEIGLINQILRTFIPVETGPLSIYNVSSIALLQGISMTPTLFFMVAGAFAAIDPALEESALMSGASRLQNLGRIVLPLVMPSLIAGLIYAFMTAVSMFEVAALLGRPNNIHVLSTLMYSAIHTEVGLPNYGAAGVYGVLILLPTVVALRYYQRMLKESHRFVTVTGKGYRPRMTDLGKWRNAGTGFIIFYYFIDLFVPFLSILWTSFVPRIQLPSMAALSTVNLLGYHSAIRMLGEGGVLVNTIGLLAFVGILSVTISLIISWIVLRTHLPGRYALDTISMAPHAIPSIAFAFSVAYVSLLIIKQAPFFYGSLAAIILADTMRRLPFTTRTISGSFIQIHREFEEAVQISGGSRVTALRKVIIPLILPAIFYSFVWAVLHAYREVSIALFLQSPRNMVIATSIWQRWQSGETAAAAALGVIMIVGMGLIILPLLGAFPHIFGERKL